MGLQVISCMSKILGVAHEDVLCNTVKKHSNQHEH